MEWVECVFDVPALFITRIQSICTPREVSEAAVCLLPIFKPDQMGDKHFEGWHILKWVNKTFWK